jgi:hypothetical protein
MRWAEQVARTVKITDAYKIFIRKYEETEA